jgi:hypothetical protein
MEGTIDLKKYEVNSAIKRCIKEMRYPPGENGEEPIKSFITIDDFKQGFKSVVEKTSSSPRMTLSTMFPRL